MEGNPSYKLKIKNDVDINAIAVGIIERHLKNHTDSTTEVKRNYSDRSLEIYFPDTVTLSDKEEKYLSFWGNVEKIGKLELVK
ncbi:hypothetical protein HYZ41_01805 [archaeon]|nr:hypothetical protein [archaeon]